MTFNDILQMIAGLALVAGLIGLVALAIRRWGDRAGASVSEHNCSCGEAAADDQRWRRQRFNA